MVFRFRFNLQSNHREKKFQQEYTYTLCIVSPHNFLKLDENIVIISSFRFRRCLIYKVFVSL